MKSVDSKQELRVLLISVLMGLTLLFIWGHSMIPAVYSSMESSRFVNLINGLIYSAGGSFSVTDHMVRKTAHFLEYDSVIWMSIARPAMRQHLTIPSS